MSQLIKKTTRTTKDCSTLIDLFATNMPSNIIGVKVVASSMSDHDMLVAVRKINASKQSFQTFKSRNYALKEAF